MNHTVNAKGCWIWNNKPDSQGYGRHSGKYAHRVMWEAFNSPIPKHLQIDHICNVRNCVNPSHLQLLTSQGNILRSNTAPAAINARKTHCPKGHSYADAYVDYRGPNRHPHRQCRHCRSAAAKAKRVRDR